MRIGLLTVLALLGIATAAPVELAKRGAKKCFCSNKAPGSKIVYGSGSSSGPSQNGAGMSGGWVQDSQHSGVYVKTVVYVNMVPVLVPVTTTCMETGTIVIENDITINITFAPTVLSLHESS